MRTQFIISTFIFLIVNCVFANTDLKSQVKSAVGSYRSFYEDLHQYPELSLKETRTAQKVFEQMQKLGLEDVSIIGGGVVGLLKNGKGPVTLVRSELDALPVEEKTSATFKSKNAGVMHACAHDLHTSATLAAVKVLFENRSLWNGTLVVVAQPGEEVLKGAKSLLEAGLFKKYPKPSQCIAIHTRGHIPEGKVSYPTGPVYATSDSIDVVFKGKGTHGATPHRGRDPIMLAAEYILKTQTLIGREIDPFEPAVITVGSVHAGTKHNIIPDEAIIQMTVRSYNENIRDQIIKRLKDVAIDMAKTAQAPSPTFTVAQSASININDAKLSSIFLEGTKSTFGPDIIVEAPSSMVAEDFGLICKNVKSPSFVALIGAQMKSDPTVDNHSPQFLPNYEKVMTASVQALVAGLLQIHRKAE